MQVHYRGLLLMHLRRRWWKTTNSAELLLSFGGVNMLLDIGIEQ